MCFLFLEISGNLSRIMFGSMINDHADDEKTRIVMMMITIMIEHLGTLCMVFKTPSLCMIKVSVKPGDLYSELMYKIRSLNCKIL